MTVDEDAQPEFCSYERFGLRFFQHAVTVERIAAGVSGLTGTPIEFGPIAAGPGKIAKVHATGAIGDPAVSPLADAEPLRFGLHVPVDLRFAVSLPATVHRFLADVGIDLTLAARAAEPLRVVIDIDPPEAADITVLLKAQGLTSSVLQWVSGMDGELKRFIVRYIRAELAKPHIARARSVDLRPFMLDVEP
ncbi:MAG: hypothetical protein GEV04_16220 [Actinophytocola sp.]|nr:hypothetical protein [Actinophytocola sp.]